MKTLSPKQAAAIANGVYALRLNTLPQMRALDMSLGWEDNFAVQEDSRFTGKSGGLFWKSLTGFGYIATGTGEFAGEVLCATRGTHMQSKADWASNLNAALQMSPSGHLVHAGFNEVWKSYSGALDEFLRTQKVAPKHVHCVGHSLGGALANLNADFFTRRGIASTVYTFGAPRVGYPPFVHSLSQRVTPERIFRVSHIADPVPMLPVFPFFHLPFSAPGMVVGAGYKGIPVNANMHSMTDSYIPSIGKDAAWKDLPREGVGSAKSDTQRLLELPDNAWGITTYSAEALRMIGRALAWLLKKAGKLVLIGINTGVTTALSAPDLIAYLISKGAQLSKEIAGYGVTLIRAVLRFLGKVTTAVTDLTMGFLRWVFGMLFETIASMARIALSRF
jgi:triacylglycerol lipase